MDNNDFVKIKYEGKVKEGEETFDKNDSLVIVIGAGYVIKGLDAKLLEMNVGDQKDVDISPQDAFGDRRSELVKLVPLAEFRRHNTTPYPGMVVEGDKMRGRVLSVNSGRVKVDFNHPLAGKVLLYNVTILEKLEKTADKVKSVIKFYSGIETDKIEVIENGKELELIVPPLIHPVMKKRVAGDLYKFLGVDKVKFSEIFDKPTE